MGPATLKYQEVTFSPLTLALRKIIHPICGILNKGNSKRKLKGLLTVN